MTYPEIQISRGFYSKLTRDVGNNRMIDREAKITRT